MKRQISRLPILFFVIILAAAISCNNEKEAENKGAETPAEIPQTQITQEKEYITLSVDVSDLLTLKRGDIVELTNTRRNETYNLMIRRVQESIPGLVSISSSIGTGDNGLATLILRDGERLSGTLQFYKDDIRYRVAYDSSSSRHYLTEVNPEEIDKLDDSAPLIPPRE